MTRICLNMIVKNESGVIERMLKTCIDIVDVACIIDTGSTDNTKEIIKKFFDSHNKKVHIFDSEFKNFRYARNVGIEKAKSIEDEFDYLLFLDADMKLVVEKDFDKSSLDKDVYTMRQLSPTLSYYNTRLIKRNIDVKVRTVTHEYYHIRTKDAIYEDIKNIFIDDIGDGGSKQNKFERDRDLFLNALKDKDYDDDGELTRIYYYLANTYSCIGDYDMAIEYYKKRLEMGGWNEEKYMSAFCIANQYLLKNDQEKAVFFFLLASEYSPYRVEGLCKVVEIYRKQNKLHMSNIFLQLIEKYLPFLPADKDILFKDRRIYDYELDFERSICYYFIREKKDDSAKYAHKLILNKKAPYHLRDVCLKNMKFYSQRILDKSHKLIDLNKKHNNSDSYHHFMNPSVTLFNGDQYINLRSVNYQLDIFDNKMYYRILTQNGLEEISLKNKLDNKQGFIKNGKKEVKMYDFDFFDPTYEDPIDGVEDIRIIEYNKKLYGIGNSRVVTTDHLNRMILFEIDTTTSKMINTVRLDSIKIEDNKKTQKNWSPFIHNGKLLLLYSFSPLLILEPDLKTGLCQIHTETESNANLDFLRGGSQGFWYNGNLHFIVHESINENGRIYLHRIIKFDKDLNILGISYPFYFDKLQIEYVAGAYVKDEKMYISYSTNDKNSYLLELDVENMKYEMIL